MNDEAWLAGLAVGDEVAHNGNTSIGTVARLTPTQVVIGRNARFNRATGRRCGDSGGWSSDWLHPVTDQLRNKVARNEALAFIRYGLTDQIPTATLVEAVAMLKAAIPPPEVAK